MAFQRTGKLASLFMAAMLVVAACSGSTTESEAPADGGSGGAITIGAAFPNSDTFLSRVQDGMKAKAEELGVELVITDAKDDVATQLSQVENFISQKVSAIVVVPVDTSAAGPMTDAAKAAGIPLVYVNRNPSQPGVPYVGSDSLFAGTVEMEELAKLAGNKGDIFILQGQVSNEAAVLRTQGCNDVAAKVGMTVVATQAGDWDRAKGQSITENWIQSGSLKAGDVICANNDEMALGAINALKAAGLIDSVFVGGVDATSEALAAMQAGELEVTVFQDASGQGGGGVQAAVDLINGKTVPDYVDIPYVLVTPANIADYLGAN